MTPEAVGRLWKLFAMLSLFVVSVPVRSECAVRDSARAISLAEAIAMAQRNSRISTEARGAMRSSEVSLKESIAAFFPAISVSARTQTQGGDRFDAQGNLVPFTGRPTSYATGLATSLQLFDGGRRYFDVRRARADVLKAKATDALTSLQVALLVKQQYFIILAGRESEDAAVAQLQQADRQLTAASARLRAGGATVSDSLRSVTQVADARLALLAARNDMQLASATLTRLVGSSSPVTAAADDSTDQILAVPDTAGFTALAERSPGVMRARGELASAREHLRSSRTAFLPTLSVTFNRGGSGLDPRFGSGPNSYAYNQDISFSLNFPLLNNLSREATTARAIVAKDVASGGLRDELLLARQSLVQFHGQMTLAQEQISLQLISLGAASEDLRLQQARYELGQTSLLDVLASQTQVNKARAALTRARLDYRLAKAQLETIVGLEL